MSKIFRLYTEGASTFTDWNESPTFPYNSNNRDNIDDPDGASARNEITSIPSPFARIDLVKNAFKMVTTPHKKTHETDLDGTTIFHKMVSDALDVGEIFFNIDKFKNKIEIIPWDSALMIEQLKQSDMDGHRYLGDALEKYLQSDAQAYNFGDLHNVYLLNFLQGPDELNIIGATSPATVFFSNANKLDYVSQSLNFGQSSPFDDDYYPLYKRDSEYIKFWFILRKSIPDFATRFPEVEEYLKLTMRAITDNTLKSQLRSITESDSRQLSEIEVRTDGQNNTVEVLGYPLLKRSVANNGNESDFVIDTKKDADIIPLVLPIDSGNRYRDMLYVTDTWGKINSAPCVIEEQDLTKRELPFDGSIRAYITIGDLMHDNIVRVPHKLNQKDYFDGSIQLGDEKMSYLLPLKPLFFKYFDVSDLMQPMADGTPMFEMERLAGGSVKVTLRIPVKSRSRNKYVEYSRNFYGENVFQKSYTDFRFKRHKNYGEKDQFLIEDHHEALVSKEDFEAVAALMKQRAQEKNIQRGDPRYQNRYPFSGKLICGECGNPFKRHMNSTGGTRYAVWVCRQHLEDVRSCGMKSVREADLQRAFTTMINKLIFAKQEVLDTLLETLRSDVQKESLRQIDQIDHKLELNAERKKTLTTLMTRGYLEPAIFAQERLEKDVSGSIHQADSLNDLIRYVAHAQPGTDFDGALFERFIDHVTICTRTEILFHLKCGLHLTERIGE